jgi:hypothetical protein
VTRHVRHRPAYTRDTQWLKLETLGIKGLRSSGLVTPDTSLHQRYTVVKTETLGTGIGQALTRETQNEDPGSNLGQTECGYDHLQNNANATRE